MSSPPPHPPPPPPVAPSSWSSNPDTLHSVDSASSPARDGIVCRFFFGRFVPDDGAGGITATFIMEYPFVRLLYLNGDAPFVRSFFSDERLRIP